jgi:hypothetical protein
MDYTVHLLRIKRISFQLFKDAFFREAFSSLCLPHPLNPQQCLIEKYRIIIINIKK